MSLATILVREAKHSKEFDAQLSLLGLEADAEARRLRLDWLEDDINHHINGDRSHVANDDDCFTMLVYSAEKAAPATAAVYCTGNILLTK